MQRCVASELEAQAIVEIETLSKKRKQVGILGGNFNPVHLAHLVVADQVQQQLGLDKVYLMPTYLPPHVNTKQTIDSTHRLAMLELAVQDNPYLDVETTELVRKGKSYTYDTMKQLVEEHPDTDYYFIIGGDMVEYLPKWYKIDLLMDLVHFVGIRRPNYGLSTHYSIIWVDSPQIDISSSMIREKIGQNCSLRYIVPDRVRHYIKTKELYINGF